MNTDKRVFDYLYEQLEKYPQERAFGEKSGDRWQYKSTAEIVSLANRASRGLLKLGLRRGDKVATVVYRSSADWMALDYALMQIGLINVPLYPTISPREYAYILNESGARYAVVGDGDLYAKVREAQASAPGLQEIFTFGEHPSARPWTVLLDEGDLGEVERIRQSIQPDDLLTLIYTSGTTGNPKGVMLSHRNVVFNIENICRFIPVEPGDRILSFLPVSHSFERAAVYFYTAKGCNVSFTGTDNLGGEQGDLKTIRPHFFTTVPRLLEKVYDKIMAKGQELRGAKRALFFWAINMADHWDFDYRPKGLAAIKWRIADRLIFSKWREALGGCVKGIITGASACPMRVMRTFNAAGIRVREGYGLTETAPALSFNRLETGMARLGTVGPLLDGVKVRFDHSGEFRPGEGEIIATSPGIMLGYYLQPEKTAEVLTEINGERWLATGDVGKMEELPDGRKFLQITDRKKELLKTSGGKYVAPTPIEGALKEHYLVEYAMIIGDDRKFVSAIIVPSEDGLREWCHRHDLPWSTLAEAIRQPQVIQRYQMLLDRLNPNFSSFEQVKKFTLVTGPWEPVKADGSDAELTPTMKLKRRVVLEKYRTEIEAMYAG